MRVHQGRRRSSTGDINGSPYALRPQRLASPTASARYSGDESYGFVDEINSGRYEADPSNDQGFSRNSKPGIHIDNQLREVDHLFHNPKALDRSDDVHDFFVNHDSTYHKSTSSSDSSISSDDDLRYGKMERVDSKSSTFIDEYEPLRSSSNTQTPLRKKTGQIIRDTNEDSTDSDESSEDDAGADIACHPECSDCLTRKREKVSIKRSLEEAGIPLSFLKRPKRSNERSTLLKSDGKHIVEPSEAVTAEAIRSHGNNSPDLPATSIEDKIGSRSSIDLHQKSTEDALNCTGRSGTWPPRSGQFDRYHAPMERSDKPDASRRRAHSVPSPILGGFDHQMQLSEAMVSFAPILYEKIERVSCRTVAMCDWFEKQGMRLPLPSMQSIVPEADDEIGEFIFSSSHQDDFGKSLRNPPNRSKSRLRPPLVSGVDLLSPKSSMSFQHQYNSNSEGEISFVGNHTTFPSSALPEDGLSQIEQKIAKELARRILLRLEIIVDYGTGHSRTPSQYQSTSSTQQTAASQTPATSLSSSARQQYQEQKRQAPEDDDSEEQSPRSKRVCTSLETPNKLFACPYAKFDPTRYSERNPERSERSYRSCSSKYLRDVSIVKQHLYRTHKRPDFYCGNCYQSFRSREEINAHSRQRPPCESGPPKYEEMMTDEQYETVKRRSPKNNQYESWYSIFEVLFPNAARPLSPYVSTNDPAVVQYFVTFFRRWGPEEIRGMRDHFHQSQPSSQHELSAQRVVDEAFEIALSIYLSLQQQTRDAIAEPQNPTVSSPPTVGNTPEREEPTPNEQVADTSVEAAANEPSPVNRSSLPNAMSPVTENEQPSASSQNHSPNLDVPNPHPENEWDPDEWDEVQEQIYSHFDDAFGQYDLIAHEEILTGLIPGDQSVGQAPTTEWPGVI